MVSNRLHFSSAAGRVETHWEEHVNWAACLGVSNYCVSVYVFVCVCVFRSSVVGGASERSLKESVCVSVSVCVCVFVCVCVQAGQCKRSSMSAGVGVIHIADFYTVSSASGDYPLVSIPQRGAPTGECTFVNGDFPLGGVHLLRFTSTGPTRKQFYEHGLRIVCAWFVHCFPRSCAHPPEMGSTWGHLGVRWGQLGAILKFVGANLRPSWGLSGPSRCQLVPCGKSI